MNSKLAISNYTLDSNLISSLNRLVLYAVRKFPSIQGILPKNIGRWPYSVNLKNPQLKITSIAENRTKLTYLGHRTVYIQMNGVTFLTDPVLSKRLMSGGFGVKRVSKKAYKYWEFPPVDFLLISNNSFDCMDTWTLRKISDQGGAIAVGGTNITRYLNQFYERFTYPLSWFEEVNFGTVLITFMPAMSETKRKYLCCGIDRNKLLWGGFLIRSEDTLIYYAGKTKYSDHFQHIKEYLNEKNCKIDVAILPIGPKHEEDRNMTPEQAVDAHRILKPKKTLVVAHDTFPLGIESFGELKTRLKAKVNEVDPGILEEFLILEEAESYELE
ncbi:hypothetical protein MACJ_000165 [Theileria orientalis]|uniref:Metallo-beta-lactamase domain-containing protein n=1 Tax=Theileria orientalis TaxID=68886 RepID=A0A976M4S6_THEOR|nr:hypothetical protein MACJ_000165 [Theileria orientalis]